MIAVILLINVDIELNYCHSNALCPVYKVVYSFLEMQIF